MRIVIYATCQGRVLADYLQQQIPGSSIVSIHNYEYIIRDQSVLDDPTIREIFASADVLIYQPLSSKYGKNSSDHILSATSADCERVSIPYLYNHAFWPLAKVVESDINDQPDRELIFAPRIKNREVIDNLLDQGRSVDDLLDMFDQNQIDFRHQQRFLDCVLYLANKESHCDIRVSDFIEKNYQTQPMFYYPSHPTLPLMQHMAENICKFLGIVPGAVDAAQIWIPTAYLPYWQGTLTDLGLNYQPNESARDFYHDIIRQCAKEKT